MTKFKYTTVGSITAEEAREIDPVFADTIINGKEYMLDWEKYGVSCNDKLKKGMLGLAYFNDYAGNEYFCICKITKIAMDYSGENAVRISNGLYSWRAERFSAL
jgi:hypothetical protein